MVQVIYFSASDTTKRIVVEIADAIGPSKTLHNLTDPSFDGIELTDPEDLVILATPVYGGRVPTLAGERLKRVNGCGQKAVVVVVYGNRDYDDALLELCDIATERGFDLLGAGAFIAEHCIFPQVATARPDADDLTKAQDFARAIKQALDKEPKSFDLNRIKGRRPYKKKAGVPLHPKKNAARCNRCGTCAKECPTGAIDPRTLKTDSSICIACSRCISVCTKEARYFDGLLYKAVGFLFAKGNARRLEPELFI